VPNLVKVSAPAEVNVPIWSNSESGCGNERNKANAPVEVLVKASVPVVIAAKAKHAG
jgi:hypothetical protein